MLPNIVGRALCLGIIFSVLKIHGALVLVAIFACQLISTIVESLVYKSKITSKMFLGILTSFTSPCLIVKELSKHFLVNGLTGCIMYIASIWVISSNASEFRTTFQNSPLILKCYQNITANTSNEVMRCPLNPRESNEEQCKLGIFFNSDQTYLTICPDGYNKWHFLWIACLIVTVILLLSLGSIAFLGSLIDVEKRMVIFKYLNIDICPDEDSLIKPYILGIASDSPTFKEKELGIQLLLPRQFLDDANKEAIDVTGKPILELMIQSKRIHITKVCTYMFISLFY